MVIILMVGQKQKNGNKINSLPSLTKPLVMI